MPEVEQDLSMQRWVSATYPGVDGVAVFTEEAFEEVHGPAGWEKAADLGTSNTSPSIPQPDETGAVPTEPSQGADSSSASSDDEPEKARSQGGKSR